MRLKRPLAAFLAPLLLATILSPLALADEGMWAFNNVPREAIKRRYGFEVTDDWLRRAQLATVRFPNGTGSFVSPEGLVLTNYHILEYILSELDTTQKDLAREGFLAHTRDEEKKISNLELDMLVSIEDVTARVQGAARPSMTATVAASVQREEMRRIQAQSTARTGLRSEVVALYQGGRYNLYRFKKYTDVRLVFVPEFQAAFFGGDADNFNFPRYNLDMGLVRVYEDGKPLHPESYFKWSQAGVKVGDVLFVVGSPGSTQRLNTVEHLEFLRDVGLPLLVRSFESRCDALKRYMARGPEEARRGENDLKYAQNFLKLYEGQLEGLNQRSLMERKRQDEQALRSFVAADARRQREYGDAWDAIARARRALATYERDRKFIGGLNPADAGAAFDAGLFIYARNLVRIAEEKEKSNYERLPEFTDWRLPALVQVLEDPAPTYKDFEQVKLTASLTLMQTVYGPDDPLVRQVLGAKTPAARAAELVGGTKLDDVAVRKALVAGGKQAITESTDPMIVLARSVDSQSRAIRKRYVDEVISVERIAYSQIARALFEKEGTGLYPDATFTPRLSYGSVKGYEENGKLIRPFTDFAGLYERAAAHKYQFPYNLPPRWAEKKSALDLRVPFNFVSTNDIAGGNSGSPTVNKNLELVGLIFDGNYESLAGNFYYDESVNRSISVDSRGMLEVLRKLYGANDLADELMK